MGLGVFIKVGEIKPPVPPIVGILDWLKAYWPWLASGGVATALVISLKKKKRRK